MGRAASILTRHPVVGSCGFVCLDAGWMTKFGSITFGRMNEPITTPKESKAVDRHEFDAVILIWTV